MRRLEELKAALAAAGDEAWRLGDHPSPLMPDGDWVELDALRPSKGSGNHYGFGVFVWGVEDDERSPKCEARATLVPLMFNALPALIEAVEALKDCHARLELLTGSGRGKMLDAVAEQRAEKALEKLKCE
jgi:hypothetical protein